MKVCREVAIAVLGAGVVVVRPCVNRVLDVSVSSPWSWCETTREKRFAAAEA